MIYLELFINFFKIGLFSFGGGYAMIPLISDVVTKKGWLLTEEFLQIIGIAEMTPGPIAVNSATFVGYKVAGLLGAMAATFGVALPSLLLILFVSGFFFKYNHHPLTQSIFIGIRPMIAGLILASALILTNATLFENGVFHYETLMIAFIAFFISSVKKMHPIMLIISSGALGYAFSLI